MSCNYEYYRTFKPCSYKQKMPLQRVLTLQWHLQINTSLRDYGTSTLTQPPALRALIELSYMASHATPGI